MIKAGEIGSASELAHLGLQLCFAQNSALALLVEQLVVVVERVQYAVVRHIFNTDRHLRFGHADMADARAHQTATQHANAIHFQRFSVRTVLFFHLCCSKEDRTQRFRFRCHHQFTKTLGFQLKSRFHALFQTMLNHFQNRLGCRVVTARLLFRFLTRLIKDHFATKARLRHQLFFGRQWNFAFFLTFFVNKALGDIQQDSLWHTSVNHTQLFRFFGAELLTRKN